LRALYVEHGAQVSGAQRSLLELLRGADWELAVACPPEGPLADLLRGEGIEVLALQGTEGSFRLHPLHTPRALVDLTRAALRLRSLARGYDVVHANSIRAGLMLALVRGPRKVVHLRDALPHSLTGRLVRAAIHAIADELIAISRYVADNFGAGVVIHNAVDLERFRPDGPVADVPGEGPLLGVFGQITPWKGQDDAIRALPEGARLIVVGEAKFVAAATRYDNRAFEQHLHRLAHSSVFFLGEREDVPDLMRACDLVLVPSWEEPFGRVVIEAMACGTPVVATDIGGPPEIIGAGHGGRVLAPRAPKLWRAAIEELLADPGRLESLGREARETAGRFSREALVPSIAALYRA
jgi:L-malate glycosyltransferase